MTGVLEELARCLIPFDSCILNVLACLPASDSAVGDGSHAFVRGLIQFDSAVQVSRLPGGVHIPYEGGGCRSRAVGRDEKLAG